MRLTEYFERQFKNYHAQIIALLMKNYYSKREVDDLIARLIVPNGRSK